MSCYSEHRHSTRGVHNSHIDSYSDVVRLCKSYIVVISIRGRVACTEHNVTDTVPFYNRSETSNVLTTTVNKLTTLRLAWPNGFRIATALMMWLLNHTMKNITANFYWSRQCNARIDHLLSTMWTPFQERRNEIRSEGDNRLWLALAP